MALNIESALRLVAKVKGVADVKKLEKAFVGIEKSAQKAAKGVKSVVSSKAFQGMAVAATGLATAIALSAKAAIDFEEKMAGVTKVMTDMDAKGIKDLRKEILDLGAELPIAVNGIADIYEAAGQAGKARGEMRAFAIDVGRVSTAFDLTAAESGKAMVSMQNALGITQDEVRELFDAINHLGDNTGAAAAELTEFMKRTAAMGNVAGFTAKDVAAIGASMIESGTETTIAATSFRRLVSALTKGASATDRQLSALRKLGFAQADAKFNEQELTLEVERQADRRVEIARNETDQVTKEIRRRYRDQMTVLGDQIDDETDETIKKIRRQSQKRIRVLRDRMRDEKGVNREAIQDQIDQIQDQADREITLANRAARDKLRAQEDMMNDREEVELKALQKKFKKEEALINEQREKQLASAKEHAERMAIASAQGLAERVQVDAMGELLGIFEKLSALPKSEMITTITDLMGEEAVKGMVSIVNNLDKFRENLTLVADETNFLGSVLGEFEKRMETTATQLTLANNATKNLAIMFGGEFATSIGKITKELTPFVTFVADMLERFPGLATALAVLTSGLVGLSIALPIIGGIKAGLLAIGSKATLGGLIAVGGVWALKFGLAVGAIALGVNFLKNLWKELQYSWKWATDQMAKITQVNLLDVWKGIEAAFDFLTKGMYTKIKNFVNWGLSQINRIWKSLRGANSSQEGNVSMQSESVQGYAEGGYVSRPTRALIGEGSQSEYVLPSNKISGFISNYHSGLRGQEAIPSSAGGGMSSPNVNIKTGPVMQLNDGRRYVTVEDLEAALSSYSASVFANSRSAGGRRFQGIN